VYRPDDRASYDIWDERRDDPRREETTEERRHPASFGREVAARRARADRIRRAVRAWA
jgi:hypothetical protein